jgi:hypothetical protein
MEAKYIAASVAAKEGFWIRNFSMDLRAVLGMSNLLDVSCTRMFYHIGQETRQH